MMEELTTEEYIRLRIESGWGNPDPSDVSIALKSSLKVFVKRVDGVAVGSIRIVGDGRLCFYIQDLMVAKEYRGRGYARDLFASANEYINMHAAYNAFIGLMAAKGLERLYAKFGFIARPNDHMGPGMIRFHGRDNELTEE